MATTSSGQETANDRFVRENMVALLRCPVCGGFHYSIANPPYFIDRPCATQNKSKA